MTAKQDKERQKMLDELADEIDVTYGDVLILVGKRAKATKLYPQLDTTGGMI